LGGAKIQFCADKVALLELAVLSLHLRSVL
jgi:hypothetical protein